MRFCINAFVMHNPVMKFCIHAFVMPRPVMRFYHAQTGDEVLSCPDQWWGFVLCRPVTVWRSVALSCTTARCGRAWEARWCCRCVAPAPAPSGPPRPLCVPPSLTPPWSAMTWKYRYDVWWFSIARLVSGLCGCGMCMHVCVYMCIGVCVCGGGWMCVWVYV